MFNADNNRNAVKNCVIQVDLFSKPRQRIVVAFDFISDKTSVNHRYIGAPRPVSQTEFVHDESIRGAVMTPEHLVVKGSSYFEIGHLAEDELACSAPATQTDIGMNAKSVHFIVDLIVSAARVSHAGASNGRAARVRCRSGGFDSDSVDPVRKSEVRIKN
jgi:hypothetical protein